MDKQLMKVARAIHMAKIDECSFPDHPGFTGRDAALIRQPWPEDRKEATRLFYEGQSYMDIAFAQARAAVKAMKEPHHD
jgi:hypothetical protein